jgi:4-hydroxy-4-methyl-2-oxoglutarate aldolase
MNTTTDALVERLRVLDSCVVSDALDALGLSGTPLGIRPMWEGAKVAGRAMTVGLAPYPPPDGEAPVHLGVRAIEAAGPGDVIVVDNGGRTEMGCWGGLLSLAAAESGVAGVVLDGACRDVDEARELRFPAFARSPIARTARGRVYERQFGRPVSIGGVSVATGDLVLADGSGVVLLAADDAERVIGKAEALAQREKQMQEGLRQGIRPSEVLGQNYQKMLNNQ